MDQTCRGGFYVRTIQETTVAQGRVVPSSPKVLRFTIGAIIAICMSLCACGGGSPTVSNSPVPINPNPQGLFACPSGEEDVMQYFVLSKANRSIDFMDGQGNPIYTEVFPDEDFAASGYWFWLKSASAHGFDVKAFDPNYIYIRSTELVWDDNTTFKRQVHDLPIAARCVAPNDPGSQIQVPDTSFRYFSSCNPYKSSQVGTALNDLDAPVPMDTAGNIGSVMPRSALSV
jgi:hypothetical protein